MQSFLVIAHRGASGYLPEHTLEGVAMAHAVGANFIEQDVVMTHDEKLIVLHDLYLEAVTDVKVRFPARNRMDGHYYAIDFTLEEVRTLRLHERVQRDGKAAFPGRFPPESQIFRIPTFSEEIALIQGLNMSTGRRVGLYVEPKSPAWHRQEGKDLVKAVLDVLADHGYSNRDDDVFLQSFDMEFLKRARHVLKTDLRLVQLIGENSWGESATDFDHIRTADGLGEVAGFADGIGPWLPHIVDIKSNKISDISDLVGHAHDLGLFVHAYTLRADQLPAAAGGMDAAMEFLVEKSGLDGVFTDHTDQLVRFLQASPEL